jgi:hypothetical protein
LRPAATNAVKANDGLLSNRRGNAMKKVLTAAVAALTIATTVAAATSDANAKGFKWGGWGYGKGYYGYGIAAGVLGAAALATYATACERVPMFDQFGNYVGSRRVCSYY